MGRMAPRINRITVHELKDNKNKNNCWYHDSKLIFFLIQGDYNDYNIIAELMMAF